jgi:hypothetical protein
VFLRGLVGTDADRRDGAEVSVRPSSL